MAGILSRRRQNRRGIGAGCRAHILPPQRHDVGSKICSQGRVAAARQVIEILKLLAGQIDGTVVRSKWHTGQRKPCGDLMRQRLIARRLRVRAHQVMVLRHLLDQHRKAAMLGQPGGKLDG